MNEDSGTARVTWLYDAQNQLTGENRTGTNAYRQTYTYDSAGNRTVKNAGGTRTTSSYDAANQLTYGLAAAGRTTYTFDLAGNQQLELPPAGARTTTIWNYENQPTAETERGRSSLFRHSNELRPNSVRHDACMALRAILGHKNNNLLAH